MTKQNFLILLLSIALSFGIFGNGIRGEFTYDDTPIIATSQDIKDPRNLFKLFVSPYYFQQPEIGLYRPLPKATYLLNYSLFGSSPISFHVVNILLHAISCFLVFMLIKFLTSNSKIAFFSFLLFLTHPIHTEAVTLIVGRAEILAFFFSILMIYLHLTRKFMWANICFLLALFSKEIAATTLPLLFYIDWVKNKKFPKIKQYLYYASPLAIYLLLRYATLGKYIFHSQALDYVENPLPFVGLPEKIFTTLKVLYLYFEKLIYPGYLTNDYSVNVIKLVSNPIYSIESILGIIILIFLILLPLHPRTRSTAFGLGAAIFLLPYLLISNFILTVGTIMGERLIYFSSLGFILILAYLLYLLSQKHKVWPEVPWIILTIIVVLFSARTIIRNEDWINNDRLYTVNLKNHPEGFLTQLYWGTSLVSKNITEAKKHLALAQKIYPNNPRLLITFGTLAEEERRDAEAEMYYKLAIKNNALAIEAYARLGYLYFIEQKYSESAQNFEKSLNIFPDSYAASYYARAEIQLGTPDKGINLIRKYFGDNPNDVGLISALGYSYYIKRDYKNALIYLNKSKELGNINQEIASMIETSNKMLSQHQ